MSAYFKGRLCNTAIDVCIDSTLLVLCIIAYIPQIVRLRSGPIGISPYYMLFNTFLTNASLSELLLWHAFAWPTEADPAIKQINEGALKGLEALGGIFGLLQVFVQWLCSIAVLLSYLRSGGQSRHVAIPAFLHMAVVLIPTIACSLPKPKRPSSFGDAIPMAIVMISHEKVAPISIVLQLVVQLWEMRSRNGAPGALSLTSVALQLLTFVALGYRWSLRIGKPMSGFDRHPIDYDAVRILYQWAFPAANYFAHALTCGVLLLCYLCFARRSREQWEEQQPLLA